MIWLSLGLKLAGVLLFRNRAGSVPSRVQSRQPYHGQSFNPQPLFLAGSKVPKWHRVADPLAILGLESCWRCAVSEPCRIRAQPSAVSTPLQRSITKVKGALTPTHSIPSLSLFLAGSKVPKRQRVCRWSGYPWAWILLGFCCFGTVPDPCPAQCSLDNLTTAKALINPHQFHLCF